MNTVFELIRVEPNNKGHYPIRKSEIEELGLFSTFGNAETRMYKDVEEHQVKRQRKNRG